MLGKRRLDSVKVTGPSGGDKGMKQVFMSQEVGTAPGMKGLPGYSG